MRLRNSFEITANINTCAVFVTSHVDGDVDDLCTWLLLIYLVLPKDHIEIIRRIEYQLPDVSLRFPSRTLDFSLRNSL